MLRNVSSKGNHGGAILEASGTSVGEAFLMFIYLRPGRRNYLDFMVWAFFVQNTYIRENRETGN